MITRLEVNNYRCLRYNKLEIPSFAALVGPNASGKSTFVDALRLLSDLMDMPIDKALFFNGHVGGGRCSSFKELLFNGQGNYFEIAVEIQVPVEFQHGSFNRVRYEIEIGNQTSEEEVHVLNEALFLIPKESELHLSRNKETRQEEMFPMVTQGAQETLMVAPGKRKSPKGWRKIVSKTETGNDYFGSETTKWNNLFKVGTKKSALANLIDDPEKFPLATWTRDYLREGIEMLVLNSRAMSMPCGPNTPERFLPDGSNLPKVLRRLRNNRVLFQDWLNQLQTALPDIQDVKVIERPEDKHLYLVIDYGQGGDVPSWLVSDGTLRMIALTLVAFLPETALTYLIEEPENGIHPKALETVMQALSATNNVQVLLATHSPLALALLEPKQILCFAKNSAGATDIVSGINHPVLKNWQGEIPIETLFASGVLA